MLNYVCAESRHIIVGPCKDILVLYSFKRSIRLIRSSRVKVVPILTSWGSSAVPKLMVMGWVSSMTG